MTDLAGKVEPNLKELKGVVVFTVEQRKHLAVRNASTCCHPLHITVSEAACTPQRVGMVHPALAAERDSLEASVRVPRHPTGRQAYLPQIAGSTARHTLGSLDENHHGTYSTVKRAETPVSVEIYMAANGTTTNG